MATRYETLNASPTFPVTEKETWLVRGWGGEPSERWTVVWVNRDKSATRFQVRITELARAA